MSRMRAGQVFNPPKTEVGNYILKGTDTLLTIENGVSDYTVTFNASIPAGSEGEIDKTGSGEVTLARGAGVVFKSYLGDVDVRIDGDGTGSASVFWRKIDAVTFKLSGTYKT